MRQFLLLSLLIFTQLFSLAQTAKGIVIDESYFPLTGVAVHNKTASLWVETNKFGEFEIEINPSDVLVFSYRGKKRVTFVIDKNDTNFLEIKLEDDVQKLQESIVKSRRISKVSKSDQENVLDFLSIGKNTLLVLKRRNLAYHLAIENTDTVYKYYFIKNFVPTELLVDFIGNIYIVSEDSVRQILLGKNLTYYPAISKEKFDITIKPIISKADGILYSGIYDQHYQRFNLIKESEQSIQAIYQSFDSLTAAYTFESEFDQFGTVSAKEIEDISLINFKMPKDIFRPKMFYLKIGVTSLFVKPFKINNSVIIFDLFADSLLIFNKNGHAVYSSNLTQLKELNPKYIFQDQEYGDKFYAVTEKGGIYSFHLINIQTGEPTFSFKLTEYIFPRKLKIIEGFVYFTYPDSRGLKKLYSSKLTHTPEDKQ